MEKMTDKQNLGRNEVIALLQSNGITPTQQRVEIAHLLFAQPQHLAAEQVLAQANGGDHHVSKATVYNTLNLFARKGLVREVIVDPNKVFYDSNTSAHHHFYNVDSGELLDVPPEALALGSLPPPPQGMTLLGADVIVRVCNAETD